MGYLNKFFGLVFGLVMMFPAIILIVLFITCKNAFYSLVISAIAFNIILGFTGISCFLALSMSIILTHVGKYIWEKSVKLFGENMDKRLDESNETGVVNKSVDNIINRFGGLN